MTHHLGWNMDKLDYLDNPGIWIEISADEETHLH